MPDVGVLVGMIIGFAVVILPLNILMFRPLLEVFDAREEQIDGAIQKTAELSEQAEALLTRYEDSIRESREEIAEERKALVRSARGEEEAVTSQERQNAEALLAAARTELEAAFESVRVEVRASARSLGRDAASRILGRELS